jgi:hypothetical protein
MTHQMLPNIGSARSSWRRTIAPYCFLTVAIFGCEASASEPEEAFVELLNGVCDVRYYFTGGIGHEAIREQGSPGQLNASTTSRIPVSGPGTIRIRVMSGGPGSSPPTYSQRDCSTIINAPDGYDIILASGTVLNALGQPATEFYAEHHRGSAVILMFHVPDPLSYPEYAAESTFILTRS